MGEIARGADRRRLFTAEFKKAQIGRVLRGEMTQAELCCELDVEVSVVRKWRRLVEQGSQAAVAANEDVVPANALRQVQQRIQELERASGTPVMGTPVKSRTLTFRVCYLTGQITQPVSLIACEWSLQEGDFCFCAPESQTVASAHNMRPSHRAVTRRGRDVSASRA